MPIEPHIESLHQKHADLEGQIDAEYQRPNPDEELVKKLKVQKLALKDEIARLNG